MVYVDAYERIYADIIKKSGGITMFTIKVINESKS